MIQKTGFRKRKGSCVMPERVYVQVNSDFDPTGYMVPRTITWPDGRVFRIEKILSFRPAGFGLPLDRYTVSIRGKERILYFERAGGGAAGRLGRWYVEGRPSSESETTNSER